MADFGGLGPILLPQNKEINIINVKYIYIENIEYYNSNIKRNSEKGKHLEYIYIVCLET